MIYIERTIKIKKGEASINEPVCLYKGDKNIEIRFLIENNPFKYKNDLTINYGQLIIKRENAPDIFSEPTKLNSGRIIFLITGDMINDLNELGNYTFQIRILNEDLTSRGTLPPVFAGISIKEPLCEEPLDPPKVYINPGFYEMLTKGGTDCSYLFYNSQKGSLDLSTLDTSKATNMSNMFNYCRKLTSLDLSSFDTNNVTDMSYMFRDSNVLSTINLSSFNTSNVTNMLGMFSYCSELTEVDVSGFDTSNVTEMRNMFNNCQKLGSLDLSNFDTSKVTSIGTMFYLCYELQSVDLSNFNLENLKYSAEYMFNGCNKLHTIRLDNCSNDTINRIITSYGFPTNAIEGVTRKIYCKEENAAGLTPPTNWVFEFVD